MRMQPKARRWLAVGLNLVQAVLALTALSAYFTGTGDGNMRVSGADCLRFFTNDSNLLAAVASLTVLPFLFRKEPPRWVAVFHYAAVLSVTVTLLTVLFFLGPTQGYGRMLSGVCLYLHLICPLLSVAALCLPEFETPLPKRAWLFGTLPVVLYGAVYFTQVVVTRRWYDFYGFNRGGRWYVSLAAMFVLSALLARLMAALQRKAASRGRN